MLPQKLLSMAGLVESLLDRLDRQSKVSGLLLALLPMLFVLLLPVSWSDGEETYFLLAHRRVAPEAFSTFHAAFDHSNARFLFEYLLGALINEFGYEMAHKIARITLAVGYAISLSFFFSALGLSVLRAVAVIALFCIAGEGILGNEWLFKGVESKTVAYVAVICALGFGFRRRWWVATMFVVIATYLHFLVGGFWGLGLAFLAFLQTRNISTSLRVLSIFLLCISPLFVIVTLEQLVQPTQISSVTPNQIYAIRLPHHIAPFFSKWQLWAWSKGIIATIIMTVAFLVLAKREEKQVLPSFIFFLLLYLCAAVAISFLDQHTLIFGKFYLFRPSSIILLLALSSIFSVKLKEQFDNTNITLRLALGLVITLFLWEHVKIDVEKYLNNQSLPDIASLVDAVERESKPDEIVLIEPNDEKGKDDTDFPYIGLPRRIPRPTLVSWKFVPTNPQDLLRWYDLLEFRKALFKEGCKTSLDYPVRLLLVFGRDTLNSVKNCGKVVWQGESGYLIRLDNL